MNSLYSKKTNKMPSKYKTLWEEELKNKKFPDRYTGLLKIDYEELKNLKNSFNKEKGKLQSW